MPCYDGRRDPDNKNGTKVAKLEAILCTLVGVYGIEVLSREIARPECGVDPSWLKMWWEMHQRRDKDQTLRHFGASE